MTAPRYGVRYPNGTWSGPISSTAKDLKPYAKQHHGTIYEVGGAEDPCPRNRPEAEPWDFGDAPRYQGDDEADAAAILARSNVEHDRRPAASSQGVRVDGPVGPHT